MNTIPKDVALRLCREIREENRGKWYRWTAWWCWGCETFCKGDLEKMCVSSRPGYRGCMQVNARYDRQASTSRAGSHARVLACDVRRPFGSAQDRRGSRLRWR